MSGKIDGVKHENNVISVPPRRRTITYKGLHGTIEYKPRSKLWIYQLKIQRLETHNGEADSEAKAELELKKLIEIAIMGKNKNIKSVD